MAVLVNGDTVNASVVGNAGHGKGLACGGGGGGGDSSKHGVSVNACLYLMPN